MRKFQTTEDEILLAICDKFLHANSWETDVAADAPSGRKQRSVETLARELNSEWEERRVPFRLGRQDYIPALIAARDRGLLTLTPRTHQALQRRLCDRFRQDPDRLRVVATESGSPEHVSTEAARLMLEVILELGRERRGQRDDSVHVGFGAGWTTRVVAHQLATLMSATAHVPPLTLHAIHAGFAADQPTTAPVSYFGFFERAARRVELVGMFGRPFVRRREFESTQEQPGVREAFQAKGRIDLVVTSLASARDEHGDLVTYLGSEEHEVARRRLQARGWMGDVQHLPYAADGPLTEPSVDRPLTLFELRELVEMAAKPGKYVFVVSCPCGMCGRTRADALVPLLENPALKLWTHLVTDIPTAREILEPSAEGEGRFRARHGRPRRW